MSFEFAIPSPDGETNISVQAGSSVIFVGANGGGKTRLAAYIEDSLGLTAHRISAHRALTLDPTVPKISEQLALLGLRTGHPSQGAVVAHRSSVRWGTNAAVFLLNDFTFLLQALFADQSNKSLETHKKVRSGVVENADQTKFEHLVEIWERLLPHRNLHITGDDIEVRIPGTEESYNASELSDGERAIFYLIGQTLAADDNSVLIIDEPELHIHRSIMSKLWDDLEATRQDCAFIYITHDLGFAASMLAQKFVISDFKADPQWTVKSVPQDSGFDEEIATLILGSRSPILFVEGNETSLDQAIYRSCFPEWTVIPRGSCEQVIHSVVTMRRNEDLTRVTCSGIVDADDYQPEDIKYLDTLGIAVLGVSEIENIILLPAVSRAIAQGEGHVGEALDTRLNDLQNSIFEMVDSERAVGKAIARYCRRRIDRMLKKVDLSEADSVDDIILEYGRQTGALNIQEIAQTARDRIQTAIDNRDLELLLQIYDNKGLLSLAATHLRQTSRENFESWLTRMLCNDKAPDLVERIRGCLPVIHPE